MNTALWQATWGYFLLQMLGVDATNEIRSPMTILPGLVNISSITCGRADRCRRYASASSHTAFYP